jgi:sugar phosphate isomerase/epimerase
MNHPHLHRTRRDFLRCGLRASAGIAAGTFLVGNRAHAALSDRYQLSIHQYSLKSLFDEGKLTTAEYPEFVKERFGFDNVEFAVEFCESLRDDLSRADRISERSKQLGIKHRALLCGAEPALDSSSAETRRLALDDHLRWAEVAKHLGCEFIRVRASSEGDPEQQLAHATEGIGALCDALANAPLSVLVENITGPSSDPDWLVELVQRVGTKRLGLIADFGNFAGDIYAGMKRLLPYSKSVCTKSWEFDAEGNETKIDFQKMMSLINDSSFEGCIAIEYLGEDPVEGVRKTAELIKRYG